MSKNLTSSSPSEPSKKAEIAKQPEPAFGWNIYSERINGRFAMVGFVILLLLEVLTHQELFSWLGLR